MQDFSGPFPVEVITRMAGVPEEFRQQVRHWIDKSLHRKPGQIDLDDDNMQANIDSGMYYYGLVQERRAEPAGRHDQPADRRRDPRRERRTCASSTTSRSPASPRFWAARARRPSPSSSAARWWMFAQHPDQWQKLLDDRSKIPAAVEELLRYVGPVQYNVRYSVKDVEAAQRHDPRGQAGVPDGRRRQPRSARLRPTPRRSTSTATAREAQNLGLGYGIHSCLGAALARMESAIALEHLLDFMPRYEVDFDGLQRVQHAECRRLPPRSGEGAEVTQRIEVDFGLCESNGVCMGIIPEVFDLDDEDYLHVLQDEVTPENEHRVRESVRQCPRQAISIVDE